ncbi:MAG: hypothetical protein IKX31_08600 [Muribaculaceae bacterium]|nr:hypothetical protein [Muribaculaceae bacterium]
MQSLPDESAACISISEGRVCRKASPRVAVASAKLGTKAVSRCNVAQ